jgi:hypothetical protein
MLLDRKIVKDIESDLDSWVKDENLMKTKKPRHTTTSK